MLLSVTGIPEYDNTRRRVRQALRQRSIYATQAGDDIGYLWIDFRRMTRDGRLLSRATKRRTMPPGTARAASSAAVPAGIARRG
jgi:hypothetical protein